MATHKYMKALRVLVPNAVSIKADDLIGFDTGVITVNSTTGHPFGFALHDITGNGSDLLEVELFEPLNAWQFACTSGAFTTAFQDAFVGAGATAAVTGTARLGLIAEVESLTSVYVACEPFAMKAE
jgi:hypothetical protein